MYVHALHVVPNVDRLQEIGRGACLAQVRRPLLHVYLILLYIHNVTSVGCKATYSMSNVSRKRPSCCATPLAFLLALDCCIATSICCSVAHKPCECRRPLCLHSNKKRGLTSGRPGGLCCEHNVTGTFPGGAAVIDFMMYDGGGLLGWFYGKHSAKVSTLPCLPCAPS